MKPVLIASGALTITAYGALLSLGLLAGAALALATARRSHAPARAAIDALLAALAGGVVGGRLAYAAIHWPYFQDHLDETWRVWLGGLAWQGGLAGGALGVWLFARLRLRQSPAAWLDQLAPGAAAGAIFVWIGCWLSACGAGREVFPGEALFALAVDAPDAFGTWAPRLPSQLFGAAWAMGAFALVWLVGRRGKPPPGEVFASFVALTAACALAVGFSRAEAAPPIDSWTIDQVLNALLLAAGAGGAGLAARRSNFTSAV